MIFHPHQIREAELDGVYNVTADIKWRRKITLISKIEITAKKKNPKSVNYNCYGHSAGHRFKVVAQSKSSTSNGELHTKRGSFIMRHSASPALLWLIQVALELF